MRLKHIGVRPVGELEFLDDGRMRKTWIERLPDGGYKLWNKRLLNSGCNKIVYEDEHDGELIYCPWCEAWFSRNQFEVCDEE
jgi:hypothetical protein